MKGEVEEIRFSWIIKGFVSWREEVICKLWFEIKVLEFFKFQ